MAKESVVIIDYGSGNLRSAAKAFEHVIRAEGLEMDVRVSGRPEDVAKAARIVLPGQGAFGDCINSLRGIEGMIAALEESVLEKARPFLGICVGMQLMASRGLEHGDHKGLGWIAGEVVPMQPEDKTLKIPHMGWNTLNTLASAQHNAPHFVLRSVESSKDFYFVHSFVFNCRDEQHLLAVSDYGGKIPAVVGRDNMVGVQFHPEKSQDAGLELIADFLRWRP